MSSPAGTVFPQDHPKFNLPPMMFNHRPNFLDGKRWSLPMPEFPSESVAHPTTTAATVGPAATITTATNGDMASLMEDIQAKKTSSAASLLNRQAAFSTLSATATSATTNEKHTSSSSSSSSAQMVTTSSHSASSASRLSSKKSQMMTHSMSASEMNVKQASSSASEVFAENRANYGRSMSLACTGPVLKRVGGPQRVISVDKPPNGEEQSPRPIIEEMTSDLVPVVPGGVAATTIGALGLAAASGQVSSTVVTASATSSTTTTSSSSSSQEVTFQQKQMTSSKTKVTTDGFSAEKVEASNQGLKRIQTGDMSYEEKHAASAVASKLETESFSAEKMAAVVEEQFQMKTGEVTQQEQRVAKAASMKVSTENFTAEKKAMTHQAERQTISSHGVTHQETHMAASSASTRTFTSATGVSTSSSSLQSATLLASQMGSGMLGSAEIPEWKLALNAVDMQDLDCLNSASGLEEVNRALQKYSGLMTKFVDKLRLPSIGDDEAADTLTVMDTMIRKSWAVPSHGNTMGYSLCNLLRSDGGLDLLIDNCSSRNDTIQFCSARVLEQCLTTENRTHVVQNGLKQVVKAARECSGKSSVECTRVGTGILAHLFKHSEATCTSVIKMGGLRTILDAACLLKDRETLSHCANAFANLSLYGDSDSHQAMIREKSHYWLFPLASHEDDNIRYYACVALVTLVANKEIEAAVLKSKTLDVVEPFLSSHNPADFAKSSVAHIHGQSKEWLQHFVPVLNSKRNEAQSLAAFHFAMEAGIKKEQGISDIFFEIGAIEPLKKVASSPNAFASRYAALALATIGEQVPHKLSQQVPLWTVEDVIEWLKQIGFSNCAQEFKNSRVDGDLLLQLNETMLLDDIGVTNGILRKRFMRELGNLKKMADYSSCDSTNLNYFLQSIGPDMSQYTYPLLQAGVDQDTLRCLTDEQLSKDCGIENSIHRLKILESIKAKSVASNPDEVAIKDLDVFISYRRSNGSQLASLLKVHLQLRGFSVFIDVERLEAGKFDNNLLESIRKAKHFILVLTPSALDRCIGDMEGKDWVHKEIVAALQSQCNIIPITDNFQWPEPEQLPEDMRAVSYFNGVRWIHDYQAACVEKLERFMKGDTKGTDVVQGRYGNLGGAGTPGTPSTGGRGCAHYHRSHSNESKGSLGSDKESRDGKELTNSIISNNLNNSSISNHADLIHSNGLVTSD